MVQGVPGKARLYEALANIRPSAHAANAVELDDGRLFVNWYAGTIEGAEDQVIVATTSLEGGGWEEPRTLIGRFRSEGEEWLPEIGVPVAQGGDLTVYFWAVPMSTFHLDTWRQAPAWRRRIDRVRLFSAGISGLEAEDPCPLVTERDLVLHGSAVRLPSGRCLLPCHTQGQGLRRRGRFLRSDSGEGRWEVVGDLFAGPGCLEPAVALRPDGRVVCYMRTAGDPRRIWYSESTDEGDSWSAVVATNLRNPGSGVDVASSAGGPLLIVYNDSEALRTPLTVALSVDEGRTWSECDVETGRGEFSYPKLLQTSGGLWHLFYTYQRTHIQHLVFDEGCFVGGRQVPGFPD